MAVERNSQLTADQAAKGSIGFGIASIVTILAPAVPLILGVGAIVAAALAKRLRAPGEAPGPEGHGLVLGGIGVALGTLMLCFYIYAYSKMTAA
ncbi:MAG: hypothetical protein GX868_10740 [Actinobacteria bacterium]|nr:hypothetical protein [Actinomycetota bacterium]